MAVDRHLKQLLGACCLVMGAVPLAVTGQARYESPEAAVEALLEGVESADIAALRTVLGAEVEEILADDPVQRDAERARFAEAAAEASRVERVGDERAVLAVGAQGWPFPIPLVKAAQGWYFDTVAGREEIVSRRIGRNELHTIATVRAYVDAQHEYAAEDRTGSGPGRYAQRFASSPGQRDGLYWPAVPGEPLSPLGPLVAEAVRSGYVGATAAREASSRPFHGYHYRILTAQGPHAPGGALSYLRGDAMTRGFGVIAYPAEYGRSGIMTFIANHQGIVFQRDLGEETDATVAAIEAYDPGSEWTPVVDD